MPETQKTIVIAGASSGFGASAVRAFADRGDRVRGTTHDVSTAMVVGFADMLASDQASDPQMVVDAYLSVADAGPVKRPTRTVVGITWGVDEVNAFAQPRQDALLKDMQLDGVLDGADA